MTVAIITAVFVAFASWALIRAASHENRRYANSARTSVKTISQQMNEPRPLPMGQKEFVEWTDRIISGALIPCDDRDSLVGALAAMLMQLGPTESHKPDAYFIHALRKAAVNEVAHANFQQLKKRKEDRAQEAKSAAETDKAFSENKTKQEARVSNLNPIRS